MNNAKLSVLAISFLMLPNTAPANDRQDDPCSDHDINNTELCIKVNEAVTEWEKRNGIRETFTTHGMGVWRPPELTPPSTPESETVNHRSSSQDSSLNTFEKLGKKFISPHANIGSTFDELFCFKPGDIFCTPKQP